MEYYTVVSSSADTNQQPHLLVPFNKTETISALAQKVEALSKDLSSSFPICPIGRIVQLRAKGQFLDGDHIIQNVIPDPRALFLYASYSYPQLLPQDDTSMETVGPNHGAPQHIIFGRSPTLDSNPMEPLTEMAEGRGSSEEYGAIQGASLSSMSNQNTSQSPGPTQQPLQRGVKRKSRGHQDEAPQVDPTTSTSIMTRNAKMFSEEGPRGLDDQDRQHWKRLRGLLLDPDLQHATSTRTEISAKSTRSVIRRTLKNLEEVASGTRAKFEIAGMKEKPSGTSAQRNRRRRITSESLPRPSDTPTRSTQLSGPPTINSLQDVPSDRATASCPFGLSNPQDGPAPYFGLSTTIGLEDLPNRAPMSYLAGPSSTSNSATMSFPSTLSSTPYVQTQTSGFAPPNDFDYDLAESFGFGSQLAGLPDTLNQQTQAPGSAEVDGNSATMSFPSTLSNTPNLPNQTWGFAPPDDLDYGLAESFDFGSQRTGLPDTWIQQTQAPEGDGDEYIDSPLLDTEGNGLDDGPGASW